MAGIRGGFDRGSLLLEPGRLSLKLSAHQWIQTGGLKQIVHTSPVVKRVTRRLGLAAGRPTFVLHDDTTGEIGGIMYFMFGSDGWPPPIEEAGFQIDDVTTWLSFTGEANWGKPPE